MQTVVSNFIFDWMNMQSTHTLTLDNDCRLQTASYSINGFLGFYTKGGRQCTQCSAKNSNRPMFSNDLPPSMHGDVQFLLENLSLEKPSPPIMSSSHYATNFLPNSLE